MPTGDGGLGSALVGEKIAVGSLNLHVVKLLGEGGFSYVYLVKEVSEGMSSSQHVDGSKAGSIGGASAGANPDEPVRRSSGSGSNKDEKKVPMVLKVTSIHSRAQRDIAEKEAKLLSKLSHPSIVKMHDTCYRTVSSSSQGKGKSGTQKERPQHLILMEYCEGGHALDVCNRLASNNQRFDLPTLIIAFGQICNAVSYLHAQRPPIVHRDLKPVNFLVKNGAYKLCDFGSAVFGHVDLRTSKARAEAEEVIQKTTTQMFRAPEMVDLYMAKKLTQATDVWALGCCLYSLAFLQNCFEEGSNLAILSGKYVIPEDNPYGEGLVELLDRMLTADSKARADMTEVILCLSAVYSGRPLPARKRNSRGSKAEATEGSESKNEESKEDKSRIGSFRTDGQGIQEPVYDPTKATEGKKLASNSVAARRKRAAASAATAPTPPSLVPQASTSADPLDFTNFGTEANEGDAFASDVGFGEMKGFDIKPDGNDSAFFGSFDKALSSSATDGNDGFEVAFDAGAWGESGTTPDSSKNDMMMDFQSSSQDPPNDDSGEKGDGSDAMRKDRPRRKRGGDKFRSSSKSVESGIESLNLGGVSGEGENSKERRSRQDEVDRQQRRSGSRRKPRSTRDRNDSATEEQIAAAALDKDKKLPNKGPTFKKIFSRNKAPHPDP